MNKSNFISRDLCPLCHKDKGNLIYNCSFTNDPVKDYLEKFYKNRIEFKYLEYADFVLMQCSKCGLLWQKYVLNEKITKRLYEKWIDPTATIKARQNDPFSLYTKYASEAVFYDNYFKKNFSDIIFFDFGMGWGKWGSMMNAFGAKVYGYDISPSRCKYADSRGITVLEWEDISQKHFDVVNAQQVLEHLSNPYEIFKLLASLVNPSGLLNIEVPGQRGIHNAVKRSSWTRSQKAMKAVNAVSPLEHINCFSRKSLINMAKQLNLNPVKESLITHFACKVDWRLKRIPINLIRPIYDKIYTSNVIFIKQPSIK